MRKILILIIAVFFYVLLIPSTHNSTAFASGCSVQLSSFHLYQTTLTGNRILLDPSTSFPDVLVNNKELKNEQITGYIFATQTGCDDEFSRWAGTYKWDSSQPAGSEPGCSSSTSYNCLDYRWVSVPRGSFPGSGNPVWTDWSLGVSGSYMVRGVAYGHAQDNSSSRSWTAGRLFFYEKVTDLTIGSTGYLSGTIAVPYYEGVMKRDRARPDYYLLIDNNLSTLTDQSPPDPSKEIQISPSTGQWRDWPDNIVDSNFNLQVDGLVPGQTYYWRIRQEGESYTTYIPGNSFIYTPPLAASPSQGTTSLNTTLTARVTVSADKLPITYYFWWHCHFRHHLRVDSELSTVSSVCGSAPNQTIANISNNTQSTTHTYIPGYYTPVMRAEFADGTSLTSTNLVTVVVENPTPFVPAGTLNSVVFQNKLWAINSLYQNSHTGVKSIYSSSNGQTWTLTGTVPNPDDAFYINSATFFLFNNQLLLMVWYYDSNKSPSNTSKLFSSSDGVSWTDVTHAGNTPQSIQGIWTSLYASQGKLWLQLNNVGFTSLDRVTYSSSDGVNWTNAGQSLSEVLNPVVFQNKLWMIKKTCSGDGVTCTLRASSSTDNGITWTQNSILPTPTTGYFHPTSVVFTDQTGIEKLWVVNTRGDINNPQASDVSMVYSSPDGINWTHVSDLPVALAYYDISSAVFQNKLWVLGTDGPQQLGAHIFSSTDGINWVAELNPCAGNISLSIPNQTVTINSPVSFTVGGLANCTGDAIRIFSPAAPTSIYSGGLITVCSASGLGCSASTFTSPSQAGTYNYSATIDFNKDSILTASEISAPISVTVTEAPGGGGGGGGGASPPAAPTNCGSGSARADALVSTPTVGTNNKFNTSGGCVVDPKAAFVPYKIPTFDDLKSLYYTQR